MVTMAQLGVNVRKLNSNLRAALITPSSTRGKNRNGFCKNRKGIMGDSQNLPSSPCFSSPMSLHAIAQLRDLESEEDEEDVSETADQRMLRLGVDDESDSDSDDDDGEVDPDDDGEVELEQEYQFTADVVRECTSNLLLPEEDLTLFIRDNFSCNLCSYRVQEVSLKTVKVGFACSLFLKCGNPSCDKSDNIIAKTAAQDVSGSYKRYHPNLPAYLGDYTINRQIILACQLSGGGGRMASTFGGLTSLSRRAIWLDKFSEVDQMIGKTQIRLVKKIISSNLQKEIALSPMDLELNKAKVTLMMDGGWDQRASGRAYNSSSVRVVSVGPRTNKVCGLVYYSKR
jgi:hypothetical protein